MARYIDADALIEAARCKELDEKIKQEMRNHYGSRYYEEYRMDGVTSEEFEKLKKLIYRCIERATSMEDETR